MPLSKGVGRGRLTGAVVALGAVLLSGCIPDRYGSVGAITAPGGVRPEAYASDSARPLPEQVRALMARNAPERARRMESRRKEAIASGYRAPLAVYTPSDSGGGSITDWGYGYGETSTSIDLPAFLDYEKSLAIYYGVTAVLGGFPRQSSVSTKGSYNQIFNRVPRSFAEKGVGRLIATTGNVFFDVECASQSAATNGIFAQSTHVFNWLFDTSSEPPTSSTSRCQSGRVLRLADVTVNGVGSVTVGQPMLFWASATDTFGDPYPCSSFRYHTSGARPGHDLRSL